MIKKENIFLLLVSQQLFDGLFGEQLLDELYGMVYD
jgi:hypothetical protein